MAIFFAYRCAASSEFEEFWTCAARVDAAITNCLENCTSQEYILYLSGDPGSNFRYAIYPEYKSNRKATKPRHLERIREYLVKHWEARVTDGYEADDAIGITLTANPSAIVCSIDKDLLQLPGKHWNFVKKEYREITEQEALKRLYVQMLVGDSGDAIPGAKGIGKVKAERILSGIQKESEIIEAVRLYFRSMEHFMITAQLIYVLREEGKTWLDRPAVQNWISLNHCKPGPDQE